MAEKKYLDLTGLTEFKNKLIATLAANSSSSWTVNYATSASQLATARTIGLSGDVSGTATSFDGSQNITIATTIADVVASTSGEGGSHGLMTAAQAEKLAGVAAGAEANIIEGVATSNSDTVTVANKIATIDMSAYAKKSDYTHVMDFKGSKATVAELNAVTGMQSGDVWLVTENNTEYVYTGSAWEPFGPAVDLSGYVEKTQKVNNKALSGDITLDGSDIALSTSYAVASTAVAPAVGDSIDTAVGKLQKEIADASAAATTYAFAEGSVDGAFQVTPTVGGVAGSVQSVAVHGLGSAANADTTAFVPSSLTPAEAGAQVNDIEVINFKGNGDSSASPLTITNKAVTIDVSSYALSSEIPTVASAIADNDSGYATGDQVYDYIEAHKAEWGDANVIEAITLNGSSTGVSVSSKTADLAVITDVQTKTTAAGSYASVASNGVAQIDLSGYAVENDFVAITTSEVDSLFPSV